MRCFTSAAVFKAFCVTTSAVVFLSLSIGASQAANNDDRTIEFVNMCPSTVKIGVNGAALLQAGSGAVFDCNANTACPTGASCYQPDSTKNGQCFFDFPDPTTGTDVLKPGGSADGTKASYVLTNPVWSNGVIVKGGVNNISVKWSGNVYAATNCDADGTNCKSGMCPLSKDGKSFIVPCASGQGPQGPTTLAEFTLSNVAQDFYDISMVNGANIAVSMEPSSASAPNPVKGNDYWCGSPGATKASGTLPGCDWSFDTMLGSVDQGDVLRAVTKGGAACSATSPCSGSDVCGYAYAAGNPDIEQSCGTQIGWWNANELCTFTNGALGSPINCSANVKGQGTNRDMYQCTGANAASCYGAGGGNCCGCPEWKIGGKTLPIAPGFSCKGTNPQWTKISEPWVNVNKMACPTAYSFPFDDATSTFTCSTAAKPTEEEPNAMNYTITFCPDGKTSY